MNLFKTIKDFLKPKAIDLGNVLDPNTVIGWRAIGGSSSYGYHQSNQYENGYSSINTLANGFMMIEPYTVDKTGTKVASNVLDRIYTPNNQMSAADFREALMVMTLVHDKVRIRVHHKSENINADTITGFTFMENYGENIVDGKRNYKLQNGENLTDDEVITLKAINPEDINGGFSPSRAARRWTTIDDYIADYQAGFFKNGAVPAGEMIITARTTGEFNDIVDNLQAKHKGAGKNNNITYSHRPTDQNGSPLNSQVEWVPFSSQNKDMALKDLFDNANKKIDSVYGVPASMRGVNDTNTYASMRVDEVVLVKYALSPLTLKIWGKFTHELNRITGGIGVAITYDLPIPQIADEEKVKAEAKSVDANTVTALVTGGFTLESAVRYVETGDISELEEKEIEEEDDPEITDPQEQAETPDQPIDGYAKSFILMQEYFDKKLENILKYNQNHGSDGRFTTGSNVDFGGSSSGEAQAHIDSEYSGVDVSQEDAFYLDSYSKSGFAMTNRSLREGKAFYDKQTPARQKQIDGQVKSITKLTSSQKLSNNTTLYRAASYSGKLEKGGIIKDNAFMSTSLRREAPEKTFLSQAIGAKNNGGQTNPYFIKINAKKGSQGIFPSTITGVKNYENEFLLPKNSSLEINKITDRGDYSEIEATLL